MPELPPLVHEPETVRRAVDDVLSRPEFARGEPSLWEQVTGWLSERVTEVLEAVLGSGQAPGVGTAILVAALVVALALAVWFARGIRVGGGAPEPAAPVRRRRGADEWRGAAQLAEHEGRWREALRCRYRWLVADLDGRGVLEETEGRTTGEYLADVRAAEPAAAAPFADATRAFEEAWYGRTPVDRPTLDAFAGSAEQVRRTVGTP